jgi:hypothetical protein
MLDRQLIHGIVIFCLLLGATSNAYSNNSQLLKKGVKLNRCIDEQPQGYRWHHYNSRDHGIIYVNKIGAIVHPNPQNIHRVDTKTISISILPYIITNSGRFYLLPEVPERMKLLWFNTKPSGRTCLPSKGKYLCTQKFVSYYPACQENFYELAYDHPEFYPIVLLSVDNPDDLNLLEQGLRDALNEQERLEFIEEPISLDKSSKKQLKTKHGLFKGMGVLIAEYIKRQAKFLEKFSFTVTMKGHHKKLALQGETPQSLAAKKISTTPPPQKRLALVIGNAAYQGYAPLRNPVNDATDLANVLKKINFDVRLETNLNYADMEDAILAFYEKLSENPGVGLFYFAGHGVQHEGESYLIPVDAKRLLKNIRHLRSKTVSASYVLDTMKATGSQVNLLILDACRNAPSFVRSLSNRGELDMPGLGHLPSVSGSLVAYAASPGGISKDGDGRNSPYVKHLMKWITKPNFTINQVLKKVRQGVLEETGGEQSPGYYDELTEDFYFKGVD